jgi:hypothetical protein
MTPQELARLKLVTKTADEVDRAYNYWQAQLRNPRNGEAETSFARGCLDTLDWLLGKQSDHPLPVGEQEDQQLGEE